MDRRKRLLGDLDLFRLTGLEIGPRHAPLVAKADGPVKYVDYTDTESLKAAQFDPSIDTASIVEVDIVWGEQRLREAAGEAVDYVVASHVVEHVPDLIGWLLEVHEVLKPGGVLGLAVPDRRFTFDLPRRESSLAEMVEAYLTEARRPSIRQVFDAACNSTAVDAGAAWRGEAQVDPREPLRRAPNALKLARSLKAEPRYIDAHCWVLTPASFIDVAEALATLELFPYAVDAFFPTEPGSIEFQVRLRALRPGETAEASIRSAQAALDTAIEPGGRGPSPLEQEVQALRAEREAILSSTSWRATAPLRGLARLLGRS